MKPSIPKGTRDFLPAEVVRRKYVFQTIERVFQKFGYLPIETPAMEALDTLSGKYGEEGERLLFKILNNGDYLAKADRQALREGDSRKLISSIAKRGLRYDLTVPFARFVVMHRNDIQLPFKRYQIQPVWRADRPQRGRYNEFYQCDADVVGSDSLVYETEFVQIYDEVFATLGLPVVIRVNHRKVLTGLAQIFGITDQLAAMTVAIDKWDKIGEEGVLGAMERRAIPIATAKQVTTALGASSIAEMHGILGASEQGLEGLADLKWVFDVLGDSAKNKVVFDPKLARGLDYYTGCIFEVECPTFSGGSIGGGGRYDDLTGVFGMTDISGAGISFGADRIYLALKEQELFPAELPLVPQVLLLPLDTEVVTFAFHVVSKLRAANVRADIYPQAAKLQKQLKYANALKIPFVVIIGARERESGQLVLKDMLSGDQHELKIDELTAKLSQKID